MKPLAIPSPVAFHEAGHACVALLLDLDLRGCHIVQQTASAGQTTLKTKFGAHSTWRLAIYVLAGGQAQEHFTGRVPHAAQVASDEHQVHELLDLTRKDSDPSVAELVHRYRTQARAYVILHEKWIASVAGALMTHKGLNAAAVAALRPRWEAR